MNAARHDSGHGLPETPPLAWVPPGPFNVEIWEVPGCWDAIDTTPDFLAALRLASRVVRRDWRVHGREYRVRVIDGDGREW